MTKFKTILYGVAIGIANIIPGVSGGTIAVILNIYDHLIESINVMISSKTLSTLFSKEKPTTFYPALSFLTLIGIGVFGGIFGFAHLLDYLLSSHNHITMMFFLGLILGSVPVIYNIHTQMSPNIAKVISFLMGGFLLSVTFFIPENTFLFNSTTITLSLALFLFLSGFIAAGSMIVPGISGSLILLLLGSYTLILNAVSQLNFTILGIVGCGAIAGISIFTKLINFFLKTYPSHTYYFILGLLVASLPKLWPGIQLNGIGALGIATFLLGLYCAKKSA